MKLDASIEPTIGPYETYEDGWFGSKAAFEAFICVRDDAETAKLAKLAGELQEIENNLPIDPKLRNPKLGAAGADPRGQPAVSARATPTRRCTTAAFNLPNDERIIKQVGSKRTMLKNVQRGEVRQGADARSAGSRSPPRDRSAVSFDAFFTHILMHELMHGLGPHETIGAGGKSMTVRAALQQSYGALEEAKADIAGLFALQYLIDKGVLDRALERSVYVTFLASSFRTLRFGGDAHAVGMALQLNTLLDAGAVRVAKDGTFSVDPAKIKDAVRALTARDHERPGGGRRREGRRDAARARRGPAGGEGRARPPDEGPRRHRAALRHRRQAARGACRGPESRAGRRAARLVFLLGGTTVTFSGMASSGATPIGYDDRGTGAGARPAAPVPADARRLGGPRRRARRAPPRDRRRRARLR